MDCVRIESNSSGNWPVRPMDKVHAPKGSSKTSNKSRTSGAPSTVTLINKTTQHAVTSDKTSSTGWTEVKSRSKSSRSKNTRSKSTPRTLRRALAPRTLVRRALAPRTLVRRALAPEHSFEELSPKNTRPKSRTQGQSYKKDAKRSL